MRAHRRLAALAAALFPACTLLAPPGSNADDFRPLALPPPSPTRTAAGTPGEAYWQQTADYVIHASLDPVARTVRARAEVTYVNHSPDPLPFLWLHLEQNAYRPDSVARSAGLLQDTAGTTEGFRISSVRSRDRDLTLAEHGTLGRLELPEPVAPRGGRIVFEVEWSFEVPGGRAMRMGIDEGSAAGPVFELAQWYPAVAVYDDVHGWNTLPYLTVGEFYTNFGSYDVHLTVPGDHVCVATGMLQNPDEVLSETEWERWRGAFADEGTRWIRTREEAAVGSGRPEGTDPLTWRYRAEDVRTFAWATSAAFAWTAGGVTVPDRGRVLCQALFAPEAPALWDGCVDMLRHSVEFYSGFLTPYPYPQITCVRGGETGMEYPMIVYVVEASGDQVAHWYGADTEEDDPVVLFDTVDHEVAHTWFPMVVNTDERRHAWMDEGLSSFVNVYSHRERYGREPWYLGNDAFLEEDRPGLSLVVVDAPDRTGWDGLSHLGYTKPARGLFLLREHVLGPERFDAAFREYVRAWSFRSPQPADFFRAMANGAGADLDWFWRGWFLENLRLDQAVHSVDWRGAQEGGGRVEATFENRGSLLLPVLFRVEYEDGRAEERRLPVDVWWEGDRVTTSWPSPAPPTAVEIDPAADFPDSQRENNSWSR